MNEQHVYVWDIPRYSPTEAAQLVSLRPERVTRWLRGYEYRYLAKDSSRSRTVRQKPVIHRSGAKASPYASFLDLVDLLFVKRFLDFGFSLQRIRRALNEADKVIGGHHFAQQCYFTDGTDIYLKVKEGEIENLLQLLSGGQWVIADVILQFAKQLDFDDTTGFADKWYPNGKQGRIVLDPKIAFGAPTIVDRGVRTANVYDLFVAEESRTERVANWMKLESEEVTAAVEFERAIAA
jgi:uncharacterized protein (DUF433 family)